MIYYEDNYLMHHGIKGQKWGVRRYQNPDGTFTEAGKSRYFNTTTASNIAKSLNRIERQNAKLVRKKAMAEIKADKAYQKGNDKKANKYRQIAKDSDEAINAGRHTSDKLIEEATKKGYTVNSKETTRYTNVGRQVAAAVIMPGIGNVGLAAIDVYRGANYGSEAAGVVKGKKYNVIRN